MTTILVVDDEIDFEYLIKRRFRTKVQDQVYNFRFIHNGRDALTLLQNEPHIDLLLLDINMPEMDGISLLRQLPVLNPLLQVVMVSAYGDMVNIRTAMNLGAFDFIMKPIDFPDLEITIDKTIEHIRKLRESQQLKIIDELKTRLFDNITREFQTPLSLVLSAAEQLRKEFPEPFKLQNGLLVVERNARQLLRLINQILDLAKFQTGELNIISLPGDLGAFIGEIVHAFEPLANTRKLQLIYQNNLPGSYAFDPEKIEQIIYNLLTNALKFTEEGTITISLSVLPNETGPIIRISIADTGLGILPEELPHIFNRFYQANNTLSRYKSGYQLNGTGIGLAIVKEIVDLMNGIVSAESKVDQPAGSRFTIDLPLPEVPDSQDKEHPQPIPSITTELSSTESFFYLNNEKAKPKIAADDAPLILVVDDSDELREFLAGSLGNNYRILTASNGADAWEMAKSELPDIVVSDVMMPGKGRGPVNGFQLTQQLKTDSTTDHIAVVLLTAKASHQHLLEGLTKGADDYIAKPFHFDELELRLRNLLTRREKLQRHYQLQLTQPGNPARPETVQNQFLRRLYQLVDTHIDEPLPVEWVAEELAMSRKTLYRKVQSLTQLSPNKLIRNYRLRRAADLLHAGHSVSETAYKVGFETSSHFARAFKELYNQTPTEFAGR